MHYRFSVSNSAERFVDIELTLDTKGQNQIELKLPVWRPGRYEEGNFAKNIRAFTVTDSDNKPLAFQKISKSVWLIQTSEKVSHIKVNYQYYANKQDAGSCYVDEHQLYINPIHCCFYTDKHRSDKCIVQLDIAQTTVATSLKKTGHNLFEADSFDELVDSPFIASEGLKHLSYTVSENLFHIWIEGDYNPEPDKLIADFVSFTSEQLRMMQDFPVKEYHFIILAVPHTFYHGVEHLSSTVIVVGPSSGLHKRELYNELIGVSSHELFHSWNIKTIRPVEMQPYNYDRENYSPSGFVYEGATTYYGDLFLYRCGYFSEEEYFNELNFRINKHLSNEGRFNFSAAESSFDTWLDGYVPGVPGRKTSIYDEGSIITLMLDFLIRKYSGNRKSIDDVFLKIYNDFGKKGKGYTADDYRQVAEQCAGKSLSQFFTDIVFKAVSYESMLEQVLEFAGLTLAEQLSSKIGEQKYGIRIDESGSMPIISNIAKNAPAFRILSVGDELIAVNGHKADKRVHDLFAQYQYSAQMELTVFSQLKLKTVIVKKGDKNYFSTWKVKHTENKTTEQELFFKKWSKRN
jgi:predicted metalloprotease with PDZ domain